MAYVDEQTTDTETTDGISTERAAFLDRYPHEALIVRLNFLVAFAALGIGGIFGLVQALHRTGYLRVIPSADYYTVLTGHGVLLALVVLHILALHEVGSNNPDGVDIKKNKDENGIPKDGIPFHPYYTVKDTVGVVIFLMLFAVVVFFFPDGGGYLIEKPNFGPADPLATPDHIAPVWYYGPYYAMLRATTFDIFMSAKAWGVIIMGGAILILFLLPWLDRNPVKSIRYKGWLSKVALMLLAADFLMLGWLGTQPGSELRKFMAQLGTFYYFGFFLVVLPFAHRFEKSKPVPERVTGGH